MRFDSPSLRWALYLALLFLKLLVFRLDIEGSARVGRYVAASLGIALLLVAAAGRGRRGRLLPIAADLALSLLLFVDLLHYRAFADLPSIASLRFLDHVLAVDAAVVDLVRLTDLLLFASLPALLLPSTAPRELTPRMRLAFVLASVALLVGSGATAKHRRRFNGNAWYATYVGPLAYHVTDAFNYAGRVSRRLHGREEAAARLEKVLASLPAGGGSKLQGAARGLNVIVIQLESFQSFLLGHRAGGAPVLPNLEAFARESLAFPNFFEQAAFGRTSDATFVANCSLFPMQAGAVAFECEDNEFRCLPAVLRDAGYQTALFQPLSRDFWNSRQFDPRLGFARVQSEADFVVDERIGLGLSDASFFRQLAPRLHDLPEPFYAYALSVTSHTPYADRRIPRTLDLGELEGSRAGWYLHAVHYTDGVFGRLIEELRESGLLDRSIVAVFGDHDGMTRATGNLEDLLPLDEDDDFAFFEEERRVPLLLRFPHGAHAGVVGDLGGQLDFAPTLLGLLGLSEERTLFFGRDLLASSGEPHAVAFPEGAILAADRLALPDGRCLGRERKLPDRACEELRRLWLPRMRASNEILERDLFPLLLDPPLELVDGD